MLPVLAAQLPFLCALCLAGAGATVRDADLASVAAACPGLVALDLSGCSNVAGDGACVLLAFVWMLHAGRLAGLLVRACHKLAC